jgi:hypothetical protein
LRQGWTNRIPGKEKPAPAQQQSRQRQRQRPQLTVDDVTNQEQMEVYMVQRLDRIEDAMSDDERSLRAEI